MFATYFDDSLRFTAIMIKHPAIMAGTVAVNVLSIALSVAAIVWLDIGWVDVLFGLLTAAAIGLSTAAAYMAVLTVKPRWAEWTEDHLGPVSVLGTASAVLSTMLGFSLFIGLVPALAVVVAPAIITSPMVWALRRWALRTY